MENGVFLNGRYCTPEEALISVDDRGFLFGDGVYEVIKCFDGKFFKMEEHLIRLQRSAGKIMLDLPYTAREIAAVCYELRSRSGIQNGLIYMQATRGAAPRTHYFPQSPSPTFLVKIIEMDVEIWLEHCRGVKAIFLPDERWVHCDIKSVNLLPNVLARETARRQGAYEAIFIHSLGITECGSSNFFAVLDGRLVTAPQGDRILSGIIRETVLQLAAAAEIPVELRYPRPEEMAAATEAFITNSSDEIAPILAIDEKPVGEGRPGKITTLLSDKLEALKKTL
ncbi:MAG: aminotransferase class IV [Bacillota bacterium]